MYIVCVQKYYMASSRELVRIVSIQKSPVIHLFSESIAGAATIRGFGQEKRFIKRNLYLLDCFARPFFYSLSAIEWLCLRMELLSTFVFAFCMVILVTIPHGSIDPSMFSISDEFFAIQVSKKSYLFNLTSHEIYITYISCYQLKYLDTKAN